VPGVNEYALKLKELADARAIRQRILSQFEKASRPGVTDDERRRLLHCVVVGGGPTGVEFAAEVSDLLSHDLRNTYPALLPDVRITLLEAGKSILNTFDAVLSAYTLKFFRRQRIDVRIDTPVVAIREREIVLNDGSTMPYGMVVWSTGVGPRTFTRNTTLPKDAHQRIITDGTLSVGGTKDVFAFGDCAVIDGAVLPMTAQVAQQQGKYLGQCLNGGRPSSAWKPFRYHHYGMLAYIGRSRALADLESLKSHGFITFIFWRSAYLTRLVSFRNKILVILDWMKTAVFGRDISRF
jgi:NADH:ubiquinone reductase (non-electrogenic)